MTEGPILHAPLPRRLNQPVGAALAMVPAVLLSAALIAAGGLPGAVFAAGAAIAIAVTCSAARPTAVLLPAGIAVAGAGVVALVPLADLSSQIDDGSGPLRLAPLAALVLVVGGVAARTRRLRRPTLEAFHAPLLTLLAAGVVGIAVGHFVLGSRTSLLALVAATPFALMFSVAAPSDVSYRRALMLLAAGTTAYLVLDAMWATTVLRGAPPGMFGHERSFLSVVAVVACVQLRWWLPAAVDVVATALAFWRYPAASYLVALAVTILVLAAVAIAGMSNAVLRRRLRLATVGAVLLVVMVLAVRPSLYSGYFTAVGKPNNSQFRATLWADTVTAWHVHPLLGSGFSGEAFLTYHFHGLYAVLPSHNDYLQMLYACGMLGCALYLAWLAYAFTRAHSAACRPRRSDDAARALGLTAYAGLAAAAALSVINPILTRPANAAFVLGLSGIAVWCGRARPRYAGS